MNWSELNPEDILDFQVFAASGVAPSTTRRRISALRSFLKFLKKQGLGPSADLPTTSGIRLPKRLPKALTPELLERLLASPDQATLQGLRDRALMEVVYGTGLRVSEAMGLRVEEVHLEQAAFRVTGKRGKTRVVPIPRHTIPWIEKYLTEVRPRLVRRPVASLFLGDRGAALSRQSAYGILEKHRRYAGIPQAVSPHTLRHTYAVHLVRGGADLRVVQELLGHASIATTQVYTQLDMDQVRAVYDSAHPRRG